MVLRLPHKIYVGLFLTNTPFRLRNTLIEGLEWCGLPVDYCDVFISCLHLHLHLNLHFIQLADSFIQSDLQYSKRFKNTGSA